MIKVYYYYNMVNEVHKAIQMWYTSGRILKNCITKGTSLQPFMDNMKHIIHNKNEETSEHNVLSLEAVLKYNKLWKMNTHFSTVTVWYKNEKAQFKAALRRYLNAHSFYSVYEFFMSTVNL
jgi:hypothetical protein